jgi:hypothetical protein
MKFFAFSAIAFSLLSMALAVTITLYSDNTCMTAANPSSTPAKSNPVVATLNSCSMYLYEGSRVKFTACSSSGKAEGTMYNALECTGAAVGPVSHEIGKCEGLGAVSFKVTCDPASAATLASVVVAAAVFAFCI